MNIQKMKTKETDGSYGIPSYRHLRFLRTVRPLTCEQINESKKEMCVRACESDLGKKINKFYTCVHCALTALAKHPRHRCVSLSLLLTFFVLLRIRNAFLPCSFRSPCPAFIVNYFSHNLITLYVIAQR